jgi:hypothetical protein
METTFAADDKPWRPGDHPRPGPSWEEPDGETQSEHQGVPDAED